MRRLIGSMRHGGVAPLPFLPPQAKAAGRYVFTLLATSLGTGRGANIDPDNRTAADTPVPMAKQYVLQSGHPDEGKWIDGVTPIYGLDGSAISTLPEGKQRISMAEGLLRRFQSETNAPVGIISASDGGSSLTVSWKPTAPYGPALLAAHAAHNEAMAALWATEPDAKCAGVIAEFMSNNPTGETSAQRRQALLDIEGYIRANFDGVDGNTPIIFAGRCSGGGAGNIGEVTRIDAAWAASQLDRVYLQHPPYPTVASDNLHPTLDESRTWGENCANVFYMANFGDQAEPIITTATSQGVVVGTPVSIAIAHTGLAGEDSYGKLELTGGGDSALFEVAGDITNPRIIEKDPGTLAAGTYSTPARVKDNDGDYGPVWGGTITASAPASVDVDVVYHGELTVDTATFGEARVTNVALRKGLNIFKVKMNGANQTAREQLLIDGNSATRLGGYDGTNDGLGVNGNGNFVYFGHVSAIDTTAPLVRYALSDSNAIGGGFRMFHFSAEGGGIGVGDYEYLSSKAYPSADGPFGTKAFDLASGDQLLTFIDSSAALTIDQGNLISDLGSGDYFVGRKTDGAIVVSAGGARTTTFSSILLRKAT